MEPSTLCVAMLREVFTGPNAQGELTEALCAARTAGAALVVLPELPCQVWPAATRQPREVDAEPAGGARERLQAAAARDAGVALLGGVIRMDDGRRFNTALLFDAAGSLVHTYRKAHIPQEAGFFEQDHYLAGDAPPRRCDALALPIGIQLCSDINRPTGTHLLAAQGAAAVLAPRATEAVTFDRWETVIQANALTACCYVLSVNRPRLECGVHFGGPSIAVAPDGEVLACTEDQLVVVELAAERVRTAQECYPGYLAVPTEMYARGWGEVASGRQ